ncbi:MAG: DUF805 domain-containing protein [Pseudomonadales bacterium]|nr:DUF805 domain-containing protein [Pseudomonadales bacterium]
MSYDALFVNPTGRTSRAQFVPALITLLAVLAFYAFLVTGRTGQFCLLVLMYPAFVLLARRVRDMGYSAWLVLVPLVLMLATFAIQLGYLDLSDTLDGALLWIALTVSAAFALWGCVNPNSEA